MRVLFVYYFNLFRQSDLASLIYNKGLYAAHFPMFPLHYACSCVWWFQIFPVNIRSVDREEQIVMTDERLSALELLSVIGVDFWGAVRARAPNNW